MLGSCSRVALAVAASLALLATTPAYSAQRTFVSTSGVNNPACSLVAPCRDFAAAITATSPEGEVIVLDSGGYGKVTITQSVSIIAAPGVYAGISVFALDDGVTVAAGASDKVTLRGLTINGQGGNRGIVVASGGEVHVERCTVVNMGSNGIEINGGTHTHIRGSMVRSNLGNGLWVDPVDTTEVHVVDSQFSRNGEGVAGSGMGIAIRAGTLDASRITISDNDKQGLVALPVSPVSVVVTLADSMVTGNGSAGVVAFPQVAGSVVRMAIARSTIARNFASGVAGSASGLGTSFVTVSGSAVLENGTNGIAAGNAATIAVTGSTIAGNGGPDLAQLGGSAALLTSENNTLSGRGAPDISGILTPNPLQ